MVLLIIPTPPSTQDAYTESHSNGATDAEEEELQKQADRHAQAVGLGGTQSARVFVNGKEFDLNVYKKLERLAVAASDQMIMPLQRDAYYGQLSEHDNILNHLMSKDGVVKRLPMAALTEPQRFVSLYTTASFALPLADAPQKELTAALNAHLTYLGKPGTEFEVKVRWASGAKGQGPLCVETAPR